MQQVLFTGPFGFPIYGFGAMLFITFIVVTWWGTARAKKIGMEAAKFQDFTIWVFISGIIGARILYMIQYANQFPERDIGALLIAFVSIWEGGIVFYGSALGGAIGYGLFYWFVMRRLNVSGWQLADVVAPLLALGLAIGRIGCYLNGCCWGQVANEEVCPVPLGAAHFPLLPAHARSQLVAEKFLQTTTGFAIKPRERVSMFDDPRALVVAVERHSPAERAGLKVGDRISKVNGEPNAITVELVSGSEESVKTATEALKAAGANIVVTKSGRTHAEFNDLPAFMKGQRDLGRVAPDVVTAIWDRLEEVTRDWPRGKSRLTLSVERMGENGKIETADLPSFTPETVGLYPTQLYETVSMILLIFLLLALYPLRRHDGQLMVVLMIGYAIHRFINESLRIEPSYTGGLTLSQWGSVVVLSAALAIEAYLWWAMPSRWKGEPPLQPQPAAPPAPTPIPTPEAASQPPAPPA